MFVDDLRDKIRGKGVRIVFTEGPDFRVQEAAVRLYKEGILEPVLLGDLDEIEKTAKELWPSISKVFRIDVAKGLPRYG